MTLSLDPRTTALVLIDLQNGILGGPLTPYDRETVVASAARLGRAFVEAGAPIFPVRVTFSADGGDRLAQPTDVPMTVPEGGLPEGWADFVPEIDALPAAVTITKRQWSAFYGTELELQLRRRGITDVVVCGVATNFGVESTARDGWQAGYAMIVAEDACSSMGESSHEFAVTRTLPRVSRIRTVDEIVAALAAD